MSTPTNTELLLFSLWHVISCLYAFRRSSLWVNYPLPTFILENTTPTLNVKQRCSVLWEDISQTSYSHIPRWAFITTLTTQWGNSLHVCFFTRLSLRGWLVIVLSWKKIGRALYANIRWKNWNWWNKSHNLQKGTKIYYLLYASHCDFPKAFSIFC